MNLKSLKIKLKTEINLKYLQMKCSQLKMKLTPEKKC